MGREDVRQRYRQTHRQTETDIETERKRYRQTERGESVVNKIRTISFPSALILLSVNGHLAIDRQIQSRTEQQTQK